MDRNTSGVIGKWHFKHPRIHSSRIKQVMSMCRACHVCIACAWTNIPIWYTSMLCTFNDLLYNVYSSGNGEYWSESEQVLKLPPRGRHQSEWKFRCDYNLHNRQSVTLRCIYKLYPSNKCTRISTCTYKCVYMHAICFTICSTIYDCKD